MTIKMCPCCGGDHYGSNKCPFIEAPCVVCGDMTVMACSDCAINSGGRESVHVCVKPECRDRHEAIIHASAPAAEYSVDDICSMALAANWRPIETALKDDTRILLFTRRHGCLVGTWRGSIGWVALNHVSGYALLNGALEEPKHWMPLPAAPTT